MSPGFSRTLKKHLHVAKERLGTVFYTKQQSYEAALTVELTNTSAQKLSFLGVFAVPNELPYQKLFSEPSFFYGTRSQAVTIQQDEKFGNRYAFFEISLESGQTVTIEEKFSVQVQPFFADISKKHSFSEYVKNSSGLKNVVEYISCSPLIGCDDPRIIEMAQKIRNGRDDVVAVVRDINDFVVGYLTYGNPLPGLYSSAQALEKKTVDCGGFDTLFVALCRALGVPARVVSGFWAGYPHNDMHAWAEFQLPSGQWAPVDPSVEQLFLQGRTRKSGRFSVVGSDRITLSVGESIPLLLSGQAVTVEILQNPMMYDFSGREVSVIQKNITFVTKTV